MLIALAGLPGSGKSTLADGLQRAVGAVVLDKDRVRAALFPPAVLDYSASQDDITLAAIYQAVEAILRADPRRVVIIDGRTFLRPGQLPPLLALARSLNEPLFLVECVCADEVARARLERDHAERRHPAGNRTFALYLSLKGAAEPISIPHLVLDTGTTPPHECVRRCREYLGLPEAGPREVGRRVSPDTTDTAGDFRPDS